MNDVLVRILVRLKSTHYFASSVLIFVQSIYMSVKLYGFTLIEFHSNEAHLRQLGPVLPRALVTSDLLLCIWSKAVNCIAVLLWSSIPHPLFHLK